MADRPWLKFYPQDWRGEPTLRACSLAARGLWIEMIALAHEATPYGHVLVNGNAPDVQMLARMVGVSESECESLLAELDRNGVFSRTRKGVVYSRRMVKDAKKAAHARNYGKEGGNPKLSIRYNKPGFIYLMGVRSDGAYKIGISNNPRNRVKKVRAQYPADDIQVLSQWPVDDMGLIEAELHAKFGAKKSGEWFFLDSVDIGKIRVFFETLKGPPQGTPPPHMPEARSQRVNTGSDEPVVDSGFERLWAAWQPHKTPKGSKKSARAEFDWHVRKAGVDPGFVIGQAMAYCEECRATDTNTQHVERWIKKHRWEDERIELTEDRRRQSPHDKAFAGFAAAARDG